ncbi:CaiB/BaiF CoA transferase family protein [Denitrobaculum tricleocarpae]|uniref:CoA transferase n=1 Tax=Denitrobaculum tricleocarpae TaxID=2591009 RepID=A0A545TY09_9PROT|nr:CoA transferase [Denitrobaculum tricleocarpae]TQV82106.1 CoA transferase [Denitrobaculum tricleocarpae]
MSSNSNLPLDGVRIVDFTQVMLGPCATQMLADFGADVIKIERPGSGELSRNFFGGTSEADRNNPVFCSLNRNKRSVTLDTRQESAKEAVYELVRRSDVVVNNFRPGVMDRMGFGYEKLREINPRIIFASGTGFGPTGPYAHKGGQDVLSQALTGVMERRADDDTPRTIYATALCDYTAGMHLVQGVLAALLAREKTGRGQEVSVSLYDSMLAMQMQEASHLMTTDQELNWAAMPLSGVFETTDGALVLVGAFKANPLQDICRALGIEDLSEIYPDLPAQRAGKVELQRRFREGFAANTTEHWIARLEEQDLLCAEVRPLGKALTDPQTIENGMLESYDHPLHGETRVIASPVHLSEAPFIVRRPPPRIGEHTAEILAELGLGEEREEAAVSDAMASKPQALGAA